MEAYQQRVVDEKEELDEKLAKLRVFFNSVLFETLSGEERELLVEQEKVMTEYSEILRKRLDLFDLKM